MKNNDLDLVGRLVTQAGVVPRVYRCFGLRENTDIRTVSDALYEASLYGAAVFPKNAKESVGLVHEMLPVVSLALRPDQKKNRLTDHLDEQGGQLVLAVDQFKERDESGLWLCGQLQSAQQLDGWHAAIRPGAAGKLVVGFGKKGFIIAAALLECFKVQSE